MSREPASFDPTSYSLATHGDSRQRRWARTILEHWPRYETFWREHSVPLTFAVIEPGNYFLRPDLPGVLEELADTQYAVFFHLAQMHEWTRRVINQPKEKYVSASEMVYLYFSHAYSLIEATHGFADAVDQVAYTYGGDVRFACPRDEAGWLRGLGDAWGMAADRLKWRDLVRRIGSYRNCLVHRKPVFLQNAYMPRPEYFDTMTGLAAIARVARNPLLLEERYEQAVPVLESLLEECGRVLDVIWLEAERALETIERGRYRADQLRVRPGTEKLTKEKILGVRQVGGD
jgi:hypothetical protein